MPGSSEKVFGLSRKCRERKTAHGQMYILKWFSPKAYDKKANEKLRLERESSETNFERLFVCKRRS